MKSLRQRLKAATGINSTPDNRLRWAMRVLGIDADPQVFAGYEDRAIAAAESAERCQKCRKTGVETVGCYKTTVSLDNGRWYLEAGHCPKEQAHFARQRMARMFGSTGLGKRFLHRRFETFEVTESNRKAYEACKRFCDTYQRDSKGILLTGGYGTGKTHLAAAILAEMVRKGVAGAFVVVPDLLQAVRRSFNERDNKDLQELFATVRTAPLLVLDDLGAERANEWVREQLFMLINARYEDMLPTVITTNKTIKELVADNKGEQLGQRIVSRIVEMTDGVLIEAEDYRMRKLGG